MMGVLTSGIMVSCKCRYIAVNSMDYARDLHAATRMQDGSAWQLPAVECAAVNHTGALLLQAHLGIHILHTNRQ